MESYKNWSFIRKPSNFLKVYQVSKYFRRGTLRSCVPDAEKRGIHPCNIAEGYRRRYRKEYIQFLHVAHGSCGELETLISLSYDLGMIEQETFGKLSESGPGFAIRFKTSYETIING